MDEETAAPQQADGGQQPRGLIDHGGPSVDIAPVARVVGSPTRQPPPVVHALDLGGNFLDERAREVVQQRLARQLKQLGLKVTVES